ncbi:hypothetical protein MNBD_CHLOROFLEXI01-186 [hydrothermal vent metagenome]|uniref:Uncharacterized protein n=2 Tax=hydrothermal vent metagenome TaxID=652676 RepID=A0A3B0VRA0_9ZZZZ
MTNFLYHRLPNDLVGSYLYPLNQLQTKFPAVYDRQVKKYSGREQLLQRKIPILNCLWNDVLHFSPVHPSSIRDAVLAAGFKKFSTHWLQIDPEIAGMSPHNAVIYLYSPRQEGSPPNIEDFLPFSLTQFSQLDGLPEAATSYYREMREAGKQPLLFHLIPHVLYRGVIHLPEATIIEV